MEYITRGNLYNPTFSFKNCDGSPVDFTNASVKFILKRTKNDDDSQALLEYTYVNPEVSNLMFEFNDEQTSSLLVGEAIGAVKVYYPGSMSEELWVSEYRILEGVING